MNKKKLPIHVELWNYQEYGLKAPSTILVEQITTIPLENLTKRIGKIDDSYTLGAIYQAMSIQFPILSVINMHIA